MNPNGADVVAPGLVRSELSFLEGRDSIPSGTNKTLSRGTGEVVLLIYDLLP